MAQAAKRHSTTASVRSAVVFLDPKDAPKTQYALTVRGTCMEPLIHDGSVILVDPTAPITTGDFVCIFLERGYLTGTATNLWVKRVVFNMMSGIKLPARQHPDSNVRPIFVVEQNNPRQTYSLPLDKVLAVHKVLGPLPVGMKTTPRKMHVKQLETV